jgi:flagellar basal body rod protein FlgG
VFLNPAMTAALDRVAERAADVRLAFTPGAMPLHADVATAAPSADFALDPLSVSAPSDSYFVVRDAKGTNAYTRDGSFILRDGELTDAGGRLVLGTLGDGAMQPLQLDPVDAALGRCTSVAIGGDGTLSYQRDAIDPRTGARTTQRVTAGRIALARFPAGSILPTADGSVFTAPSGVVPHTGLAADGNFSSLTPMRRERSRVDLDASLARLKEAYVAFDALAAAENARGGLSKTAMNLLK